MSDNHHLIGEIVHYVLRGSGDLEHEDDIRGTHRPALIVSVDNGAPDQVVDLVVFTNEERDGFGHIHYLKRAVGRNKDYLPGSWHERENS